MSRFMRAMATACAASALALGFGSAASAAAPAAAGGRQELPEPPRAIKHILVIELENEDASTTFGPAWPGGRPGLRDAAECADDRGPAGRGLPVEHRDELA
jgi:hypothetical protein